MCGIFGGSTNILSEKEFDESLNLIIHRGPDGFGTFVDDKILIGHRRLSILDVENGSQPMNFDPASHILSYNGEVYNYLELKDQLKNKYKFQTTSDTEVIYWGFLEWGYALFEKLEGMFAIAIYDLKKNELILARDHFGVKPLFYNIQKNGLIFSSETRVFKSLGFKYSKRSLDHLFLYHCMPKDLSSFEGVYKLQPGHYGVYCFDEERFEQYSFWKPEVAKNKFLGSFEDAKEELNRILEQKVAMSMRSDVEVGLFLSGGVDSTIVSKYAKNSNALIRSYAIGFEDEQVSELKYAQIAANRYKLNHHEKIIGEREFNEFLENIPLLLDEPFCDSSMIPTYFVSKYLSSDLKVTLSGDGGDELFCGYKSYINQMDKKRYSRQFKSYFKKLIGRNINSNIEDFESQRYVVSKNEIESLGIDYSSLLKLDISRDDLTAMQINDIENYMVNDVLTKVDRMSMLNSLEVRPVLLNKEIAEFALSLPQEYKIINDRHSTNSKRILKSILEDDFDASFVHRSKMGFGIPYQYWIDSFLKKKMQELLVNKNNIIFDFYDFHLVQAIVKNHYSGTIKSYNLIWTIYILSKSL